MSNHPQNSPGSRLRFFFAPFTEGPRAWAVLLKNAVPVVGMYWFEWSSDLIVFQIWFAGAAALGAMLAFQVRVFAKRDPSVSDLPPGAPKWLAPAMPAMYWLMFWLLLGIPYWFTLLVLGTAVFQDGFWLFLVGDPRVMGALLLVAASSIVEESKRGYPRMSNAKIRLEFNWEFSMHLARVAAILLAIFMMRPALVVGLALALSCVEIYPMWTLRFLGVHRSLEDDNEDRSRD